MVAFRKELVLAGCEFFVEPQADGREIVAEKFDKFQQIKFDLVQNIQQLVNAC